MATAGGNPCSLSGGAGGGAIHLQALFAM
jgi:hypothetical protein